MNTDHTNDIKLLERTRNILSEITLGEIYYGFSTGGYEQAFIEEDLSATNSNIDIDYMIETARSYLNDYPNCDFISITVVFTNAKGDIAPLTCLRPHVYGAVIPLINIYKDKIFIIEENIREMEFAIKTMKSNNEWNTRIKWYDTESCKCKRFILVVNYGGNISSIGSYATEKAAYDAMVTDFKCATNYTDEDITSLIDAQENEDYEDMVADCAIFPEKAWAECAGIEKTRCDWSIIDTNTID